MSVKIRPINRSDIKRMAPSEAHVIKNSPMTKLDSAAGMGNNVVSSSIFGVADHSDDPDYEDKVYEDKYTRVGYIPLTKPVLNPFIAGRKAPVWRSILGINQNKIVDIIDVRVCYDLELDKEVRISDVGTTIFNAERYIYGADYLVYLLDNVDIQETLKKALIESFLYPVLTEEERKMLEADEYRCVDIVKVPTSYLLGDDIGMEKGYLYGGYGCELFSVGDFVNPNMAGFTNDRIKEMYSDLYVRATEEYIAESKQFP